MIDMMAGNFLLAISGRTHEDENYANMWGRICLGGVFAIDVISNEHGEDSNMDEILS